ncbi:MAG: hypothetical protein Q8J74_06965, partial [Candidatus Didemnitutus sp.]|nr:hypothetical protein [Candidatus Didemnitutus sp.]
VQHRFHWSCPISSHSSNALDLTCIADDASAQHGPFIQKRRPARSAGEADLNRLGKAPIMFEKTTCDLRGDYRPAAKDWILVVLTSLPLALVAGSLFTRSAVTAWSWFDIGVVAVLALFPIGMSEMNLRTVRIDEEGVSGCAPLRLYCQTFRHDQIERIRLTPFRYGYICEILHSGRWIVLASNDSLKTRIQKGA